MSIVYNNNVLHNINVYIAYFISTESVLTPAHEGWGYSHPLCRLWCGRHKVCECSTASIQIFRIWLTQEDLQLIRFCGVSLMVVAVEHFKILGSKILRVFHSLSPCVFIKFSGWGVTSEPIPIAK